ncbi:hypothetical protein Scep_005200 [Stephania cephalantha]|uniref:Uncharacterized protein n=1 Tax=Stephania cephalantha TaxID=152367 RepID=A0AAP0KU28_9MAGN
MSVGNATLPQLSSARLKWARASKVPSNTVDTLVVIEEDLEGTETDVAAAYSQYESGEEEETPVKREETSNDEEDMNEEDSNYVDDEDAAVDEGTTEPVSRDPYDSQDDMNVDKGGKFVLIGYFAFCICLLAIASFSHDDDVGHDFLTKSVTADKGNDKGEDPTNKKVEDLARTIHFTPPSNPKDEERTKQHTPLPSPNQREEQPMEDSFKQ